MKLPLSHMIQYTLANEPNTEATCISGTQHWYTSHQVTARALQKTMSAQVHGCAWENKNRCLLIYFGLLIFCFVFEKVYACALPVGKTHAKIALAHSSDSVSVCPPDVNTLQSLQEEMSSMYAHCMDFNHPSSVAIWSGQFKKNRLQCL